MLFAYTWSMEHGTWYCYAHLGHLRIQLCHIKILGNHKHLYQCQPEKSGILTAVAVYMQLQQPLFWWFLDL